MKKAMQRLTETLRFGVFVCQENAHIHNHPYVVGGYENTRRLLADARPPVKILYSTCGIPLSRDGLIELMRFGRLSQEQQDEQVDQFIRNLKNCQETA